MSTVAVAIFVVAYILIAAERVHRVAAALGGAAAMALVGIVNAETAFFRSEPGIDWNVIFLLLGMMIIVSVLRQTGVFEYLAIWAAKTARGRRSLQPSLWCCRGPTSRSGTSCWGNVRGNVSRRRSIRRLQG